jgi:hypothetical protein
MIVIKRILIGLGVLFVAVIILFSCVGESARAFRKEQEPFVQSFVWQLSKHWNIAYLDDELSTGTVRQRLRSTEGQQALLQMKPLGVFRSARDFELLSYNTGTEGSTGTFSFKAIFEYGDATVRVTVTERDGNSRVSGLTTTDIHVEHTSKTET